MSLFLLIYWNSLLNGLLLDSASLWACNYLISFIIIFWGEIEMRLKNICKLNHVINSLEKMITSILMPPGVSHKYLIEEFLQECIKMLKEIVEEEKE